MNLSKASVFMALPLLAAMSLGSVASAQESAPPTTAATAGPQSSATINTETFDWIVGPAKAELGDVADIVIPKGYRFLTADYARIILRMMNNPVPKSLAGLMTPESEDKSIDWLVIFEFNESGYVKEDPRETLDPAALIKMIRAKVERQNEQAPRIGAASIAVVNWQMEPEYDREHHTLEWALRAESGPQKVINHVVRLLGRRGVLDAIAVQPSDIPFEAIPLKQLMNGVSFKAGEAYADYRKGDKVSEQSLAELITSDDSEEAKKSARLAWFVAGGSVLFFGGLTLVIWRRRVHAHSPGVNGHTAKRDPSGPRAQRMFDYQRFYADLMLQVSEPSYHTESLDKYRHARAQTSAKPAATRVSAASSPAAAGQYSDPHLQLIAEQKILIEEQQRLIREQTRLIEEKTKLIQEKNQVLEKQTELFGNSVF